MKFVLSGPEISTIGLHAERLRRAGIACEIRNQAASSLFPGSVAHAELWVLQDADLPKARAILGREHEVTEEPENDCTAKVEKGASGEVIVCLIGGIVLLILSSTAFLSMILGDVDIVAHYCQRYGLHVTSRKMAAAVITGFLGFVFLLRGVDLSKSAPAKGGIKAKT
jgi:hypothetical protein